MVVTYCYTPDRSKGELDSDKFVNSAVRKAVLSNSGPGVLHAFQHLLFPLYWWNAADTGKSSRYRLN